MRRRPIASLALALVVVPACLDPLPAPPTCGDGKVEGSEACDEGALNGTLGHCAADCSAKPALVSIQGDIMPFGNEVEGARAAGATISMLEHPEISVQSDADGHFTIDGLTAGTTATLVLTHPAYETTQTATITIGAHGIDPFTIQPVSTSIFKALSALIGTPLHQDQGCIVATTVTRVGGSLYVELRQGEAGATVALDPPVPAASGPIYFNEQVIPTPGQPATSKDGGAVFINVPPGTYTLFGAKAGRVFNPVTIQCRAGVIVNAGPPLGVAADVSKPDPAGGAGYPSDLYGAVTDSLCDATATCVNTKAGMTTYPAATVASCKAQFRNTWAAIDPSCDPAMTLREAARTFYGCRAASCTLALGDDTVCAGEEQAWNAAIQSYGTCYASHHAAGN